MNVISIVLQSGVEIVGQDKGFDAITTDVTLVKPVFLTTMAGPQGPLTMFAPVSRSFGAQEVSIPQENILIHGPVTNRDIYNAYIQATTSIALAPSSSILPA